MAETPLIAVHGATLRWNPGAPLALEEVSVELEAGTVTVVLGPNGSGKSTLLRVAAGLIELVPDCGVVQLSGRDLRELTVAERARRIAYVGSDLRQDFPLRVHEVVGLSAGLAGGDAEGAMVRALCWSLRDRNIQTLSGGERQLVLIARALAQGSRALLLDETLSRMDLNHQVEIGKLLRKLAREERRAVALVAHDLNLATEWADSAILMRRGRIQARGPVASTVTEASLQALYPGSRIHVIPHPTTGAPKLFFE